MTELLQNINDLKQEHAFGRDHVALLDLSDEAWIQLSGEDAKDYLHRTSSNDVEGLKDGQGQHGLYLNPKGKILSELHSYQLNPEAVFVQLPSQSAALVLKRFNLFILNSRVTITDEQKSRLLLSVQGPKANAVLQSLGQDILANDFDHKEWVIDAVPCRLIKRSRTGSHGFDLVIPKDRSEMVVETVKKAVEEHGGGVVGAEALETIRLEAWVPVFGKEITQEVLPQEAYLEKTAISFEKGCYPGQETVAKIKYRGQVQRHLVTFEIDGERVPTGRPEVQREGQKVGVLTSAARLPDDSKIVGLGYVKSKFVDGADLDIAFDDTLIHAHVKPHPRAKTG
jgi:folate-binding protein YgfZ